MIKIAKLQHYQNVLQKMDISAAHWLAGTGLHGDDLNRPEQLISTAQYQKAIENMLRFTGDDGFGLRCGQQLSLLEMGLSGFVLHASQSLRDALHAWFSYSSPVYGDLIRSRLVELDDYWALEATVALPLGAAYRFCLDEFLMLCNHTGASVHSDKKLIYHHIHMPTPRSSYASEYQTLFNCPVTFDMPVFSIGVSYPGLDTPIHADTATYQHLYQEFCELMNRDSRHYGAYSLIVHNELLKSPADLPTLAQVATAAHCSESTLKRHLQHEGTSYRQLVNAFRCQLAKHYLTQTRMSVKQVAYQVGYTDSKPFQRAFKEWVGMPPGQYRNGSPE